VRVAANAQTKPAACNSANSASEKIGSFERKGAPVALDDVDDQLRMLPVFVLGLADKERTAADLAEQHVARSGGDFAG
jgi:hypothetical protein